MSYVYAFASLIVAANAALGVVLALHYHHEQKVNR